MYLSSKTYYSRTDIALLDHNCVPPYLLKVPILQLVGSRSAFVEESSYVNSQLDPSQCDWVKISDACGLVLDDKPESVTHALVLFLQGLGYCELIGSKITSILGIFSRRPQRPQCDQEVNGCSPRWER